MKNWVYIAWFLSGLIFINTAWSNEADIPELQKKLEAANSDTAKVQALCDLSIAYRDFNVEESEEIGFQAFDLAMRSNNKHYLTKSISVLASLENYRGNFDLAIYRAQKGLEVLNVDTVSFSNNSAFENMILGGLYTTIGMALDYKSNYAQAIGYHLKALEAYKKSTRKQAIGVCHNNLGISYLYLGDNEKSKDNFEKAYDIFMIGYDTLMAYSAKMNLAFFPAMNGDFEEAIRIFKECASVEKSIGNKRSYGNCITNIGECYREMEMYDSCVFYLELAHEIDVDMQDKEGLTVTSGSLGEMYFKMGNHQKAREYYNEALAISLETGRTTDIITQYNRLVELEESVGNFAAAVENFKQYSAYRDSLAASNNDTELGKVEATYEYNQKVEIQKEKHKKNLEIEAAKTKQQSLILYFSLGILGVIVVFVLVVLRNLKETKAQKEIVESTKAQIEEKNEEILGSIRYAKHIQMAFLKDVEHQIDALPNHFIYFEPKDIVSGDFYWSTQQGNYWYLAVGDCTGHGVPGAMLTMLGTSFLNEICAAKVNLSPAEILDQLKLKVTKELSQKGKKGESKDGMDMSLIRVDLKNKTIEWSGANNPLYIIEGNELTEIKADKQPIGYSENVTSFNNHKIKVEKEQSFYLFTDGFADQFGGLKGKKYKYANFKKFLVQNVGLSMDEQRKLLQKELINWKGDLEQLDDICVVGIQLS